MVLGFLADLVGGAAEMAATATVVTAGHATQAAGEVLSAGAGDMQTLRGLGDSMQAAGAGMKNFMSGDQGQPLADAASTGFSSGISNPFAGMLSGISLSFGGVTTDANMPSAAELSQGVDKMLDKYSVAEASLGQLASQSFSAMPVSTGGMAFGH